MPLPKLSNPFVRKSKYQQKKERMNSSSIDKGSGFGDGGCFFGK
jgi:hypothetical protein